MENNSHEHLNDVVANQDSQESAAEEVEQSLEAAQEPEKNDDFSRKFAALSRREKEIRAKELQKVNAIFLSSIFKKNKNYLGLQKFLKLSSLSKTKIVALGGISKKNKKKLRMINLQGFAGITYFQ